MSEQLLIDSMLLNFENSKLITTYNGFALTYLLFLIVLKSVFIREYTIQPKLVWLLLFVTVNFILTSISIANRNDLNNQDKKAIQVATNILNIILIAVMFILSLIFIYMIRFRSCFKQLKPRSWIYEYVSMTILNIIGLVYIIILIIASTT